MADGGSRDKVVDYYALLGVAADAAPREINRALKTLRAAIQQDASKPLAERQRLLDLTGEARPVLLDAERRAEYDARLAAARGSGREVSLPVAGQPVRSSHELIREAGAALDRGDLQTAGDITGRAVVSLDTGEAWALHARVLGMLNQPGQAVEAARCAVARAPGEAEHHAVLGEALEAAGSSEATQVYQALHRLAPGDPRGATGIARSLAGGKRFGDALEVIEPVHERYPADPVVAHAFATALCGWALTRPGEYFDDGRWFITSAEQYEQMVKAVGRALDLPFADEALRAELLGLHRELERLGRSRLALRWFRSLPWTVLWYLMLFLSPVLVVESTRSGNVLVALLGACVFVLAAFVARRRSWAPRWEVTARKLDEIAINYSARRSLQGQGSGPFTWQREDL